MCSKAFIAVVGMRGVGESLKGVLDALKNPFKDLGTLWRFGKTQMSARLTTPDVPVQVAELRDAARTLGQRVRDFGLAVQNSLRHFRNRALRKKKPDGQVDEELLIIEEVLKSQYMQERLADAACELYFSSCTLSRLDWLLSQGAKTADEARDVQAGRYFLTLSNRRIKEHLAALWDNDDDLTTQTANAVLES